MSPSSCSQRAPLLPQVSATTYNEGSSRSHTILRLTIESSERPDPDAPPSQHVARTLSVLNLIDLAGMHITIRLLAVGLFCSNLSAWQARPLAACAVGLAC